MTDPAKTPCLLADAITTGDRNHVYGHPSQNFANIAALWSVYLGKAITAEQVAVCQMLVKVERLRHAPGHWDSIVDIAGYANCAGMILMKKKDEEPEEQEYVNGRGVGVAIGTLT